MGLFLRYNLFHTNTAEAVYGSFVGFYANLSHKYHPLKADGEEFERIDFHQERNGWVVVSLDGGWERKERRAAQLHISRQLWCPGFLVFVYDGDYWGYEFFDQGEVLDQFVQESSEAKSWFPDQDCRGKPEVIAEHLPFLRLEDISPYLVQKHDWVERVERERTNVPPRPGDEFRRFDECAVLDFLRMLGVSVGWKDGYLQVDSPVFRSVFKQHRPLRGV